MFSSKTNTLYSFTLRRCSVYTNTFSSKTVQVNTIIKRYLGEKQGMLVNDECSSWYNKVGDFLMSVWDRRKEILYGNGSIGEVSQNNPTPECVVNGTGCYDS